MERDFTGRGVINLYNIVSVALISVGIVLVNLQRSEKYKDEN